MKTLLTITLLTFLLASSTFAQTKTVEPLSWKGMIIDTSSPSDVITKFGQPEKEETSRLDILNTKSNLFTQNIYKKEWRILKYKEIEQAINVRFAFNKDNKLVFIKFNPSSRKSIDVQAFLKSFENTNFKPKEGSSLQYILFSKQEPGYILAEVTRSISDLLARKSIFDTKTIEDVPNDNLEGIIVSVQFISKSLENNDNTDVLK